MNYQKLHVKVSWSDSDTDIDLAAFMLDEGKWIPSEEFMVFFNNRKSPDGALLHSGDDRFGGAEGENLQIDLGQIAEGIEEILFVVSINAEEGKINNFGHIPNAKVTIVDDTNERTLIELDLSQTFPNEAAVEVARLYLRFGRWRFEDIQVGYKADLAHFVNKFVY